MKEEMEKLLIREICSRLPYGIKVHVPKFEGFPCDVTKIDIKNKKLFTPQGNCYQPICTVRLFLRPMSNMTEVEKKTLSEIYWESYEYPQCYIDYCNKHHLDYKGLIEKGLATIAPEKMYS